MNAGVGHRFEFADQDQQRPGLLDATPLLFALTWRICRHDSNSLLRPSSRLRSCTAADLLCFLGAAVVVFFPFMPAQLAGAGATP
jgi:hypothetical protein